MNKEGRIFVISAPSGTGKDTVVGCLLKKLSGLRLSVSATTRQPRPGEVDGVHYYFVTTEQFEEMIGSGQMLEYAVYSGNLYGTPLKSALDIIKTGNDAILVIDVVGAGTVKKLRPDCVTIFLLPPSMEVLEARLRGRQTETEEAVRARLARAAEELALAPEFDYRVVNDQLEHAAAEVAGIIQRERKRT